MNRLLHIFIAISIVAVAFCQEAKAQYIESGTRSDYVSKGKIIMGGNVLEAEDAVRVMGEHFGNHYKKALAQQKVGKTMFRAGVGAMAVGAVMELAYQFGYDQNDYENNYKKYMAMVRLNNYGFLIAAPGLLSMIAGGFISQGATNKVNVIRNNYNKSLSQKEVSYSVDLSGAGFSLSMNF